MKFYAGIGSRSTPEGMLLKISLTATYLEKRGYVLRSGGADGADKAFESGVKDPANKIILRPKQSTKEAEAIAEQIHPMWSACNDHARKLHGRNVQIVLGEKLDQPADFVLAWTPDGKERGGTRTGLVLAQQRGIPTYNLADADISKFVEFLKSLK